MKRALLLLALAGAAQAAPRDELRVTSVDVEGGAATLVVTPRGRSLLIDTGWPAGRGNPRPVPGEAEPPPTPSSAERIAAAAREAGLSRIDRVLVTHYHVDHVGGLFELARLIPIGEYIDHGPNREVPRPDLTPAQLASAPATLYAQYEALVAGKRRTILKAGDRIRFDGLVLTAITSDGTPMSRPLARGSKPQCTEIGSQAEDGGEENPRSLGVMLGWGRARILSLADVTWNLENRIACPQNLTGPVDLLFANNHGSQLSNSPLLLGAANPRVVIVNNGPTKGADAVVLARYKALPRLQALWQLHSATRSPEADTAPAQIANIDRHGNHNLAITVDRHGMVAVGNPRTGEVSRYSVR